MPTANKSLDGSAPLAALAVALIANSCLRTAAAYTARSGFAAASFTIPVLALVSGCFLLCWRFAASPFLRVLWVVLLFLSSVGEILRINTFLQKAYPGTTTAVVCGFLLLLPVFYLRRGIVLVQVGRVLLWLLVGGGLLLVGSVLPQLRFEHLQFATLQPSALIPTAFAQLSLYPEYLLPVLWSRQEGCAAKNAAALPALGVGLDCFVHLLLELFFGAAALERSMPLYTAACSGALSVFTRLEWFQLFLWCAASGLRLALYFFAVTRLLGWSEGKETPLLRLLCYGGLLLLFCVLFASSASSTAFLAGACTGGMWALAALTLIGGAAAWLCQKAGSSC